MAAGLWGGFSGVHFWGLYILTPFLAALLATMLFFLVRWAEEQGEIGTAVHITRTFDFRIADFQRPVLGCIDGSGSDATLIFQNSSGYT